MRRLTLNRTLPLITMLLLFIAATLAQGMEGFHQKVSRAYQRSYSGSANQDDLEICAVCHISMQGNGSLISTPAGNTYPTYSSPTLDALAGSPGGASLQCLGCHDGAIVDGDFSTKKPAIDLQKSHPIGMEYDSILAARDRGLHDPETTSSGLGGSISQDLLIDGRVECISCHAPHASADKLMRKSNQMSALCLTCHDK